MRVTLILYWRRSDMNIKQLVSNLTLQQQEELLTEMMNQGELLVHVYSLETTFPVDDVYDNSSELEGVRTVLLVDYAEE
jgi:serine protease inhibitor